jgi:hypothetical protein
MRSDGRPWAFFCLRRKSRIAAHIALPVIILSGVAQLSYAQDATWIGPTPEWNDAANWMPTVAAPPTVPGPNGTAIFSGTSPTSISMAGGVDVGALQFTAPNYTFDVPHGLIINGSGVNASLANAPTFSVIAIPGDPGTSIIFDSATATSSAGTAKIVLGQPVDTNMGLNGGYLLFLGNSTADRATITTRDASDTRFRDSSTAGHATLTATPGGSIFFENASSADHATITMLPGSSEGCGANVVGRAIRGLEVGTGHAASTAFQISEAVLFLTRSLPSLN